MKRLVQEQYQAKVDRAREFGDPGSPREGWVRTVRKALGMTGPQLAHRLGLSRSQVSQMERMESEGRITLKQLRRVADALQCDLVYALVPRRPVEDMIRERAEVVARKLVGRADTHMKLEAQQLSASALEREVKREVQRLLAELPRNLWKHRDS
jgi:predicted DNA-binding mobile mystery protein A